MLPAKTLSDAILERYPDVWLAGPVRPPASSALSTLLGRCLAFSSIAGFSELVVVVVLVDGDCCKLEHANRNGTGYVVEIERPAYGGIRCNRKPGKVQAIVRVHVAFVSLHHTTHVSLDDVSIAGITLTYPQPSKAVSICIKVRSIPLTCNENRDESRVQADLQ